MPPLAHWLYRDVFIPAFETGWHRRGTFGYLRSLEESQWWDRQRHETEQLAQLQKLLAHANESCPYYRDAWQEADLKPASIRSLSDLQRWPLVTRETIREHRKQMRSSKNLKLIHKATGGSSGVPLQFDLDLASNDRKMAAWHRGYAWAGAGLGTKQFYLWGGAVGKPSFLKRCKDAFYHGIYRRKIVNSFGLSEAALDDYAKQLNSHRPEAIVAYVNPLYTFARMLEEKGIKPWSPKSIVVGAEKLHDFQREVIERVFQAPVFETYGSREFMLIGGECEKRNGFHLTSENLIVEVVDDDGRPTPDGMEGNLVITDLTNYGMPFIRYVNGDRAVAGWHSCSCGRGLPVLKKVTGRSLDVIETVDGRHVPGEFFPHLLKDIAPLWRFQVVQESPEKVTLKVVLRGEWPAAQRSQIEQEIREVLGPGTAFSIEPVSDIPLTAAGKLRVVVNLCVKQGASAAS
jgi:phenylacetate-CoA ligase